MKIIIEKWTNKDKINALKLIKETERTRFEVLLQGPTNLYIQELNDKLQALNEDNESNPIDYFRLPGLETTSQEVEFEYAGFIEDHKSD